ncbi:hypothetical protein CYY_003049 [Polysphondylium violaceum]|uniref:Transmembrane protein n=1 Tax=Polysphondylium violaceum TaxID=133409 RepID=A0A8J4Q790_9MYCE|nr:hypothetical protein CYY_003049 [Polysphondylium violaceum]
MRRSNGLICLFGFPSVACLIIFAVFFTLKLSNKLVSWSWVKIFSPLWITMFLVVAMVGLGFKMGLKNFLWSALSSTSLLVFVIMLPRKLDSPDDPRLNWPYVFIPLWVFLALLELLRKDKREMKLSRSYQYYTNADGTTKETEPSRPKFRYVENVYKVYYTNTITTILAYTILECISLTVKPLSWGIKFIPFFYYMAITVFGLLTMSNGNTIWALLAPLILSCFYLVLYFFLIDKLRVFAVVMIPAYLGLLAIGLGGLFLLIYIN